MKRVLTIITAIGLLLTALPPGGSSAAAPPAPTTVDEVLAQANQDMEQLYGRSEYFPRSSNYRQLRTDLLASQLGSRSFQIVYGTDHGDVIHHNGKSMHRYVGYTVGGDPVSTKGFPWDAGWSGTQIQNFSLIKKPWRNPGLAIKDTNFNDYQDRSNPYLVSSGGTFDEAIIAGLNEVYAGKKYQEFMHGSKDSEYADRVVYQRNATPSQGGKWTDYVHILQPPTFYSWGAGRIYLTGGTYLGIPIAPFNLLERDNDLSAHFESLPSGAIEGQQVRVAVKVKSTFDETKETEYEWSITSNSEVSAEFDGSGGSAKSGKVTLSAGGQKVFYVTFAMPPSDVRIKFAVNKHNNSPKEAYYDNNKLDSGASAVRIVTAMPKTVGEFDLDYNVLSRDVQYPLANGADIVAQLNLPPSSYWDGNATGSLGVSNQAPSLLRNFQVGNNPDVNEAGATITRNPIISSTLSRTDFGDNPLQRGWLNNASPTAPRSRTGTVWFSGSVSRNYIHEYEECSSTTDSEGVSHRTCETKREHGSTSAPFTPGVDERKINVYVYNGRTTVPAKDYKDQIDTNAITSLTRKLWWTSEPYKFNVIRWMAHQATDGSLTNWTDVPGQFQRTFTQQATGDIKWTKTVPQAKAYEASRAAAAKKQNVKAQYDRAVFATDRELQKHAYPVKAGYYFNPAGEYTFTVETVTYKTTRDDTQDHKDLVDAVIDSFRYETDLMFVNNKKQAVNLANEALPARGQKIGRRAATLTAAAPKGVDAMTLLTVRDRSTDGSRYEKEVVELEHAETSAGSTHPYWKNILEGYGESGTSGSDQYFKYQEFVKNGQHIYKITEKTTVTIAINPQNLRVYTNVGMPDGEYYVKAWIGDVQLSQQPHAYRKLGTLVGIKPLDEIKVSVVGSMYDDLNN
ncbi:Athe_2463 domain-containing protein [Paenibacillus xanthanilyticus]|uniref:Athe_2463 domain-containing protein n=1 Tax=Paenibacillus xanthanilyticus TaxID=1783531 RepID=A0ABV8K834_9BACL